MTVKSYFATVYYCLRHEIKYDRDAAVINIAGKTLY